MIAKGFDRKFLIIASLLLSMFFSCSDGDCSGSAGPDVVKKGDKARKTLLVYMMAENSLNNYAGLDVAEIVEAVERVPNDCRLFV